MYVIDLLFQSYNHEVAKCVNTTFLYLDMTGPFKLTYHYKEVLPGVLNQVLLYISIYILLHFYESYLYVLVMDGQAQLEANGVQTVFGKIRLLKIHLLIEN